MGVRNTRGGVKGLNLPELQGRGKVTGIQMDEN